MSEIKICGFARMYNEITRGHLHRYLSNFRRFCDDIVIYDDASTDGSADAAKEYTDHVVVGTEHDKYNELAHKQKLMDYAKEHIDADYFFWLDADEILCRHGILNIRLAINEMEERGYNGGACHEAQLWRGENYVRLDGPFAGGWFTRLWKNLPELTFLSKYGLHASQCPTQIDKITRLNFRIIHYGTSNFTQVIDKCFGYPDVVLQEGKDKANQMLYTARDNGKLGWICDEEKCHVELVHPDVFPIENVPDKILVKPEPRPFTTYDEMIKELPTSTKTYADFPDLNILDWYHNTKELLLGDV